MGYAIQCMTSRLYKAKSRACSVSSFLVGLKRSYSSSSEKSFHSSVDRKMAGIYLLFLINLLFAISTISASSDFEHTTADQSSLLSFKSLVTDDPYKALSSWNGSLGHCEWRGVSCSRRHPERVAALELDSLLLAGSISPSLANLTFLQRISLSGNRFTGLVPEELGRLHRLQYLNLSLNSLYGTIPPSLGNCSNLQVISLRSNMLHGLIPSNLSQCLRLRSIDLRNNFLEGEIPSELGSLQNLTQLILGYNNLTGIVPAALGNLGKLLILDLPFNGLTGSIPSLVGNLSSLLYFAVYNNNLSGLIPPSLGSLPLQTLDVSHNSLTGTIPPSLSNLSSLNGLSIARNNFYGLIPSYFGTFLLLTHLDCSENNLSGEIPSSLGQLSSLVYLDLALNGLSGKVPSSLYNLSSMVSLAINSNQLEGTLPLDIGNVLPNLQALLMYDNLLEGRIPASLSNASELGDVELGFNSFTGTIPSSFGILQSLYWLDISNNQLEAKKPSDWNFIASLSNCSNLQVLDIGHNILQGMMPTSIVNLSTGLDILALDNNRISGSVPTEIGKFVNLTYLDMSSNLLRGAIPAEIGQIRNLQLLDLSNNMISGEIPPTLGNLTQMNRLYLCVNELEGTIPPTLGNMAILELLNLSNNKLSGSIPKEVMSLSSLSSFLDLSHNLLNNSLPLEVGSLINIRELHLSNNKLSSEIPSTIGECQILESLYMDGNLFEGPIPSTFSNLRGLQELDLASNLLSGQIPEFLDEFPYLQYVNLSYNNFEGQVPITGVFKNVTAVSLSGNRKLCGGIPELRLPKCTSNVSANKHHSHELEAILIPIGGVILFLTIIFFSVRSCKWITHSRMKPLSMFSFKDQYMKVSYDGLFRATKGFSSTNLIGTGSFGSVYKGDMKHENATIVAVKVLNLQQHGASNSFTSECEALRSIRHRNLVKILTSCSSVDHQGNDFKALVYAYMPNGNLEEWLHPNACKNRPFRSLSFIQRLNIAIDIAAALEYLHHHGSTPIVHCDLKPSNVLLDDDMVAHVGDFGLAKFLIQYQDESSQQSTSTAGIKGSIGYIPPEYGMGSQASILGDVYSYGILLLELFTGISPIDNKFKEGLSLHMYAQMAFPEQVMDIVDNRLFSAEDNVNIKEDGDRIVYQEDSVRDCLVSVIKYGLICSSASPKDRLEMTKVAKELIEAKVKLLRTNSPKEAQSRPRTQN